MRIPHTVTRTSVNGRKHAESIPINNSAASSVLTWLNSPCSTRNDKIINENRAYGIVSGELTFARALNLKTSRNHTFNEKSDLKSQLYSVYGDAVASIFENATVTSWPTNDLQPTREFRGTDKTFKSPRIISFFSSFSFSSSSDSSSALRFLSSQPRGIIVYCKLKVDYTTIWKSRWFIIPRYQSHFDSDTRELYGTSTGGVYCSGRGWYYGSLGEGWADQPEGLRHSERK